MQHATCNTQCNRPYGKYTVSPCDFDELRTAVRRGRSGTGPYVIEASKGGCTPDESCIASYLMPAAEYTYIGCLHDEPQLLHYPDLLRPLGAPTSDAKLGSDGVWTRSFAHGGTARWYPKARKGTMQWPGQPVPPVPGAPQHVDAKCGKLLENTAVARDDLGHAREADSAQACCDLCSQNEPCIVWAWHAEQTPPICHLHSAKAKIHTLRGCFAGHMANRTAG